jgi:hypothetical protein
MQVAAAAFPAWTSPAAKPEKEANAMVSPTVIDSKNFIAMHLKKLWRRNFRQPFPRLQQLTLRKMIFGSYFQRFRVIASSLRPLG